MRHVFIGDIHGDFETLTQSYYWAKEKKAAVVFMGDITDSLTFSKRSQLYCLKFVNMVLKADDFTFCLWGNHDLSYINPDAFYCSGYSGEKDKLFEKEYSKLVSNKKFTPFYSISTQRILATHAGFDKAIIPDHYPEDIDPIEILSNRFKGGAATVLNSRDKFLNFGKSSGGYGVGGITWTRPSERTGPLKDYTQIAGHTPQDTCNFSEEDKTWYIDTIGFGDKSILMVENGKFNKIKEEEWRLTNQ